VIYIRTLIEVYCGGGIGASGLAATEFRTIKAYDWNKQAVEAYNLNHGNHAVVADLSTLDPNDIPDADGIFGGPPCQDYSVAGDGEGENGERGKLVYAYLTKIKRKQPKFFVFENVKGLISKKHRHTFDTLLTEFDDAGYNVSWRLINAWDYGVAQKRERVFIVGVRKDLGFTYQFPEPTPEEYRTQTLRDVIGDLPDPAEQINGKYWTPKSEYTYGQANRVQPWSQPSNTIPAHHNSGQPIHPDRNPGRFTIRECLRIQSVPDSYILPDHFSLGAQYRVVGNGIPAKVVTVIFNALATQLDESDANVNPDVISLKETVEADRIVISKGYGLSIN
jgi:DNA (cytosine-5)-methyltransferase 1